MDHHNHKATAHTRVSSIDQLQKLQNIIHALEKRKRQFGNKESHTKNVKKKYRKKLMQKNQISQWSNMFTTPKIASYTRLINSVKKRMSEYNAT